MVCLAYSAEKKSFSWGLVKSWDEAEAAITTGQGWSGASATSEHRQLSPHFVLTLDKLCDTSNLRFFIYHMGVTMIPGSQKH